MTMCIDLSLNLSMGCRPFLHPTTVAWFECERRGGGESLPLDCFWGAARQTYKLQKRLKPGSWGGRCWPIEREGRQQCKCCNQCTARPHMLPGRAARVRHKWQLCGREGVTGCIIPSPKRFSGAKWQRSRANGMSLPLGGREKSNKYSQ